MFYPRDPRRSYYGFSPEARVFGAVMTFLTFFVVFVICAIYIGMYILLGVLIVGAAIGLITAIFALCKALPQTIKDMSAKYYVGNKFFVVLKKIGYFLVCISKYSIYYDYQYAQKSFQKFQLARFWSFSKWYHLAMAVTVLIFGVLTIIALLLFIAFIAANIIGFAICAVLAAIAITFGASFLFNMFFVIKNAILSVRSTFSPLCFKLGGRCYFSDLLLVPKSFFSQIGRWINTIWIDAMNLMGKHRIRFNNKRLILLPLAVALIVSSPLAAILFIVVFSMILIPLFVFVYLIDAIWICIKAIFKF